MANEDKKDFNAMLNDSKALKANGELNPKYPGGVEAHKEMLD